jgi:hypothetical protein
MIGPIPPLSSNRSVSPESMCGARSGGKNRQQKCKPAHLSRARVRPAEPDGGIRYSPTRRGTYLTARIGTYLIAWRRGLPSARIPLPQSPPVRAQHMG